MTRCFGDRMMMTDNNASDHLHSELILRPVGVVRSKLKEPSLTAGEDDLESDHDMEGVMKDARKIRGMLSEIVIDSRFDGILDGLEHFSHIMVLYWPHRVPDEKRGLIKVHPMGRKDFPLVGVFATCSPVRPNPILITAVELVERRSNTLKVRGLEAVDGSPVLDIKPYNPHYYFVDDVRVAEWMKRAIQEKTRK